MSEPRLLEKEFWQELIGSPNFKYLLNVFQEHKNYLDKQTLQAVRDGKLDEAVRYQAKSEDMGKIVDLIKDRIKEII